MNKLEQNVLHNQYFPFYWTFFAGQTSCRSRWLIGAAGGVMYNRFNWRYWLRLDVWLVATLNYFCVELYRPSVLGDLYQTQVACVFIEYNQETLQTFIAAVVNNWTYNLKPSASLSAARVTLQSPQTHKKELVAMDTLSLIGLALLGQSLAENPIPLASTRPSDPLAQGSAPQALEASATMPNTSGDERLVHRFPLKSYSPMFVIMPLCCSLIWAPWHWTCPTLHVEPGCVHTCFVLHAVVSTRGTGSSFIAAGCFRHCVCWRH